MMIRALGVAVVLAGAAGGCGTVGFNDAVASWRFGDRGDAVSIAEREYERFRRGYGVEPDAVAKALGQAREELEQPILVPGEMPMAPPDVEGALQGGPNLISNELKADLLSGMLTRTLRAVGVVQGLGMDEHGHGLLLVVFTKTVITADGVLLDGLEHRVQDLAVRRAALEALQALRGGR